MVWLSGIDHPLTSPGLLEMASTYGKEASSPLVVHLYGPSRVKVSSPATKKAIAANGTAVAVLSSTAAVDKPLPRKKVTSLWVPQELTDKEYEMRGLKPYSPIQNC